MNDSDTRPPSDSDTVPTGDAAMQPEPAVAPRSSTSLDRELAEAKDRLLRTLADMDNMRKRTEREVADARVYGMSNFARDILGRRGDQGAAGRRRADRARADQCA